MLRKSNDKIEQAFKQKILEGSFSPPPNAWEKLSKNLPQNPPVPINYWKWWAIAATILLFLLNGVLYYGFSKKVNHLENQVFSQQHQLQHLAFFQGKSKNAQQKQLLLFNQLNEEQAKELAQIHQNNEKYAQKLTEINDFNKELSKNLSNTQKALDTQKETNAFLEKELITSKNNIPSKIDTVLLVQKDSIFIKEMVSIPTDSLQEKEENKKSVVKFGFYAGTHLIYRNIVANQIEKSNITGVRISNDVKDRVGGHLGGKIYYPLSSKMELIGAIGFSLLQEKYQLERTTVSQMIQQSDVNELSLKNREVERKEYERVYNLWTYFDVSIGTSYEFIPKKWSVSMTYGINKYVPLLSVTDSQLSNYNSNCSLSIDKKHQLTDKYDLLLSPYLTFYLSNAYQSNQVINMKPYVIGFQCVLKRK